MLWEVNYILRANHLYSSKVTNSSTVKTLSTFPISLDKLKVLNSNDLYINSPLVGKSTLGLISLDEFIIRGLESPEHIPTVFKLGYADQPIVRFTGSYLKVKDSYLTFVSKGVETLEVCSYIDNIVGKIRILAEHINYLEFFNSHNWRPLIG